MGGKRKILARLTWLAGITPSRWCDLAAGVAEMISWIGLTKRGSQAEGEDISPNEGGGDATVLFCIPETSGWKHLTRFCRQYAWIWAPVKQKHRPKQKHAATQREEGESAADSPLSSFLCFLLTVSVFTAGTAAAVRNVLPSENHAKPAGKKKSNRISCCKEIRERCVYLSSVPAVVLGRKSAASLWRDAICRINK